MWTRTLWVFLGSQASLNFLAFPEPTCGSKRLSGAFGGRPCFKTHRKPRVFGRFLRFCVIQRALRFFSVFFENVSNTTRFHVFLESRGYGSVPAFPSFWVARSSKTASETNFGHFPSHAWPKKFDFVASEAIRSHFPSLIQPYMVRKCSFRGFRNSFGHFQWPIPRLIFGISWALAQKCWFSTSQCLFFRIS